MKLFTLISIGSERYGEEGYLEVEKWAMSRGATITFILLDEPERLNLEIFGRIPHAESRAMAVESAQQWQSRLPAGRCLTWSATRERFPSLEPNRTLIERLTGKYRSLENAVLSETFSNLRPRFRELGVRKKTEEAVRMASQYLRDELALKLTLAQDPTFDGEAALYPQLRAFKWLLQHHRNEINLGTRWILHFQILSPYEAKRTVYPLSSE